MAVIGKFFKQAQKMQNDMAKIQAEMAVKTVEATAGGGMVTVTANGNQEITGIKIEKEVVDYINQIEARGGIIKATESGWVQKEIARSSYIRQKEIAEGKRIIVGVNKFASDERPTFEIHRRDPKAAEEMKKRLEKLRKERDNSAVQRCLAEIGEAAKGKDNLTPLVLDAIRNYATMGEICGVLRSVFGEYQEPILRV